MSWVDDFKKNAIEVDNRPPLLFSDQVLLGGQAHIDQDRGPHKRKEEKGEQQFPLQSDAPNPVNRL